MAFGETTSSAIERAAAEIVNAAFKIHSKFGPGLLESAYHALMVYELRKRGLDVETEVPLPVCTRTFASTAATGSTSS
jgi:GxxExxY protein